MDLPELASKCLTSGLGGLTHEEFSALRDFFRKEIRKGAYRPQAATPAGTLEDFCKRLAAVDSVAVVSVIDYQLYLRRHALALASAGEPMPLASLILYATWAEHWLNMMITVGMLRQQKLEQEVAEYFAARPRFKDKVDLLGSPLNMSPPPTSLRATLIQLVKTRNSYVHYNWEGRQSRELRKEHDGVRALVGRAEALLDGLITYERSVLDAPFDELVEKVFPRAG